MKYTKQSYWTFTAYNNENYNKNYHIRYKNVEKINTVYKRDKNANFSCLSLELCVGGPLRVCFKFLVECLY